MASPLECSFGSFLAGEPVVVTVNGEVDLATSSELEACVLRAALEGAPSSVVLDLAGLTFIDSSGLRTLVSSSRAASEPRRDLGAP